MSEFKELVKSFAKSREYVRDFFVYGFKTRDDFTDKSGRTYDNERRRIESWLNGFVTTDYTSKGKNLSLSIDSNLLDSNPLYRVWKTKSFTDNDVLLFFFILDELLMSRPATADALTDNIIARFDTMFDVQMVRRKCNRFVKEGLLLTEKSSKELYYQIQPDTLKEFCTIPNFLPAIDYFQLACAFGYVGNTIMDLANEENKLFRVKHSFFVHTLEDEVLLSLLEIMHQKKEVFLQLRSTKNHNEAKQHGVPLKIFTSTRSGRRFLCLYNYRARRFNCIRMDAIKKAEATTLAADYDVLKEQLEQNLSYLWGVSFDNGKNEHLQWIKLTLRIKEPREHYIITRLEAEGKGGSITRIDNNTYVYENKIFDANEMLPWIRTFTGRIIELDTNSEYLKMKYERDLETMYQMYDIE